MLRLVSLKDTYNKYPIPDNYSAELMKYWNPEDQYINTTGYDIYSHHTYFNKDSDGSLFFIGLLIVDVFNFYASFLGAFDSFELCAKISAVSMSQVGLGVGLIGSSLILPFLRILIVKNIFIFHNIPYATVSCYKLAVFLYKIFVYYPPKNESSNIV